MRTFDSLPGLPRVQAILADRGYRGLARLAARKNVKLDIKAPPPGHEGLYADRDALQGRARLCPTRPLAQALTLLRRDGSERAGLARSRRSRLHVCSHQSRADLNRSINTNRAPGDRLSQTPARRVAGVGSVGIRDLVSYRGRALRRRSKARPRTARPIPTSHTSGTPKNANVSRATAGSSPLGHGTDG